MADHPITIPSIEQDSLESEDILNLNEFLMPQGLEYYDQFGLHFNKKVFNGWVKQPSPCCGAACVAGVW